MAEGETGGGTVPTGEALRLWVVLSRAYEAIAVHGRADVARHGLSVAEFGALEALYHKGPMLLGELQHKILVSSGGITYVLDRLEKKGLATRRPCASDRRATYAGLTDEGQALIGRIFPEHVAALEKALGGLGAEEQKEAVQLLEKLGRHAEGLGGGE